MFASRCDRHLSSTLCLASLLYVSAALPAARGGKRFTSVDGVDAAFITALEIDNHGAIWIGTEEKGLYRYDPNRPAGTNVTRFTTADGLGDNYVYAIACDRLSRIWVGHVTSGVSIYNGERWVTIAPPYGPVSGRVTDMACCPADGAVWIATPAGLTRYTLKGKKWRHYTRADGLPSVQIVAMDFDTRGNLYAGTECSGIVCARAADDYARWRQVKTAERFGPNGISPVPVRPRGTGLPSNCINDILVAENGAVYAATAAGLAVSTDRGMRWSFTRGTDYDDKLKGLALNKKSRRKIRISPAVMQRLLPEDYVTCLAEGGDGTIWLGFRRRGLLALDTKTGKKMPVGDGSLPENYVFCAAITGDSRPVVGTYRGGVVTASSPVRLSKTKPTAKQHTTVSKTDAAAPELPAPAGPPSFDRLYAAYTRLAKAEKRTAGRRKAVVSIADDWRTQGAWLGRYGRYWGCLCAIRSPRDYVWGAGDEDIDYYAQIGPNCNKYDSIRYWVHWLYTDQNRSLELPPTYLDGRILRGLTTPERNRRQAEWDDHKEAYALSRDGPHLYCSVRVPDGTYVLSLYDVNKDGHRGNNRYRDYCVSIRRRPFNLKGDLQRLDGFYSWPEEAAGRIRNFWSGVWKRYVVAGPTSLTIELNANYSFNTILAGIMLDRLAEEPPPYFKPYKQWHEHAEQRKRHLLKSPVGIDREVVKDKEVNAMADALFDAVERLRIINPLAWARLHREVYIDLLRHYEQGNPQLGSGRDRDEYLKNIGTCRYHLGFLATWEQLQEERGLVTARQIETSIKWDRLSYSNSGKGRINVLEYIDRHRPNYDPRYVGRRKPLE